MKRDIQKIDDDIIRKNIAGEKTVAEKPSETKAETKKPSTKKAKETDGEKYSLSSITSKAHT